MTGDAAERWVAQTIDHVRTLQTGEASGHDWWHSWRVYGTALKLAAAEGGDRVTVALAALLHDVADDKMHGGDAEAGLRVVRDWLDAIGVDAQRAEAVCACVQGVSYKGAGVPDAPLSLEGQIVQDADRLDAMGAVGIARCFAFGGAKGRVIFDPEQEAQLHATFEAYRAGKGSGINHFYEKLLLLKDRMKTPTGRAMAQERHDFMLAYLKQFFAEVGAAQGQEKKRGCLPPQA